MKFTNKKTLVGLILGVIVLIVLVAVMFVIWNNNRAETQVGNKNITVRVVDDKAETIEYKLSTDEEYLRGALEQIDGLVLEGEEGEFGLYVQKVNGLRAEYNLDNAYWSFYINGEYCMEGIETQPIADGDVFTIQYELAQ